MSTRERPELCCDPEAVPSPMAIGEREHLVSQLRALGDSSRLEIFRFIAAQPAPVCVCDVVERFSLTQPTISHHLKTLREAGLLSVSRRGVWAYYEADPRGLTLLQDALASLTAERLVPAH